MIRNLSNPTFVAGHNKRYANDNPNLRSAACLPFGKNATFHTMNALF